MPSASSSIKSTTMTADHHHRKQSTDSIKGEIDSNSCGTANTTTTGSSSKDQGLENPLKMGIKYIEHKIRNLDKRKEKLDSYKQELCQGKELNPDQLVAVSKYTEVIQQLEFAKEIEKNLTQLVTDYSKVMKKQQKKEQLERCTADAERIRQTILIQVILRQLTIPQVRRDLKEGANGAVKLTDEEFAALDELAQIASLDFELLDQAKLTATSEHLINLIDEKQKSIVGDLSYKDAKTLILGLSASDYFEPSKLQERLESESRKSERGDEAVQAPTNPCVQTFENQSPNAILGDQVMHVKHDAASFGFLQQGPIDIESPHMDPAVVAVSSYAPPMITQINETNTNMFNAMTDRPGVIGSGSPLGHTQIVDMVVNNMNMIAKEDNDTDFNEWVNPDAEQRPKGDWNSMQDKNDDDAENDGRNYQGRRGGRGSGYRGGSGGRGSRGSTNNGYRGGQSGSGRYSSQNGGRNGTYGGNYERRNYDRGAGDADNHFGGEFKARSRGGNGSSGYNNRNENNSYGGNRYGAARSGSTSSQYRGGSSFRGSGGSGDGNGVYQ